MEEVLAGGGLAVVPTDTVYGLAARADRPEAIRKIFAIKGREFIKPLAVLAADIEPAIALGEFPQEAITATDGWPGRITIVVPRSDVSMDIFLGGDGKSIAIRVPDADWVRWLMRGTGPLAVTSANISGSDTPISIEDIAAVFGGSVDAYVDGGTLGSIPSAVHSFVGDRKVIR